MAQSFTFRAKTTRGNLLKLLRSLQLPGRAILLEGSPGVGKTSLVQALANVAGYSLTRINLSEQTDISDLFGADLPVDGAEGGTFAWRDGPFLKALKEGHWILLDEVITVYLNWKWDPAGTKEKRMGYLTRGGDFFFPVEFGFAVRARGFERGSRPSWRTLHSGVREVVPH